MWTPLAASRSVLVRLACVLLLLLAVPSSQATSSLPPYAPSEAGEVVPVSAGELQPQMRWQVSLADQQRELWGVTLELVGLDSLRKAERVPQDSLTFHMPNWSPGVYREDIMGANVSEFRAWCATSDTEFEIERNRDDTWVVHFAGAEDDSDGNDDDARSLPPDALNISYTTPGRAHFIRGGLGVNYANFLGTAMFVYVRNVLELPSAVTFTDVPEGWQIHTQLARCDDDEHTFHAVDYDELVDSPTLIGPFDKATFEVAGATIEIVVAAPERHVERCRELLVEPVRKICEVAAEMFGGLPFERYTFLYYLSPAGFGGRGLEHTNSTQIWTSVHSVIDERRRRVPLFITAHEFFHLWNVKRIRATPIRTYDYSRLPVMDCLWFHEGVTSYYTDVYLARAGLMYEHAFRQRMENLLGTLNRTDDYYDQGEAWGFLLDCLIRHYSDNRNSLDDLFRIMWHHYGIPERGFEETAAVMRIASGLAGTDLSWFAEHYILGEKETPVAALLEGMGYAFHPRGRQQNQPYWGFTTSNTGDIGAIKVEWVMPLGPAARAGVEAGDTLLELNGEAVCDESWPEAQQGLAPNAGVTLKVQRGGGRTIKLDVELGQHFNGRGRLVLADPAGESLESRIYDGILEGTHRQASPSRQEAQPEAEDDDNDDDNDNDNAPQRPQDDDEDF